MFGPNRMAIPAAAEFLFCRFRRFREIMSFLSDVQSSVPRSPAGSVSAIDYFLRQSHKKEKSQEPNHSAGGEALPRRRGTPRQVRDTLDPARNGEAHDVAMLLLLPCVPRLPASLYEYYRLGVICRPTPCVSPPCRHSAGARPRRRQHRVSACPAARRPCTRGS
eukprot:COSAG01_NODE_2591_length_7409_cov_109.624077_2_plen_164_part_00